MKKNEFSTLYLNYLNHNEAASVFSLTVKMATPYKDYIGELGRIALTSLTEKIQPYVEQVNQIRKSELTGPVIAARNDCDNVFAEIKRAIKFELKSRDESRKVAAQKLVFFYTPNWDLSKKALGAQMESTTNMMLAYNINAEVMAAAQVIGVDTLMSELETNNSILITIYLARNKENGDREISATNLRPEATEAYTRFCKVIEQAANLMTTAEIHSLFNSMDELRIKNQALTHKGIDKPNVPPVNNK